jgi:hypothetical protein
MSVRASTHPMLRTLSSSGRMYNHPTPSLQTPFRLFRLSPPRDLLTLHPNHKTKKRKRRPLKPAPSRPRSLPVMMNVSISTQRRIRRTHTKFVAINAAAAAANNVGGEGGEGGDVPTTGPQAGLAGDVDADDAEVDAVDEQPCLFPNRARNWPFKCWAYIPLLSGQVFQCSDL